MAAQVKPKSIRRPKSRELDDGGCFFPGEVVRILRLEDVDYRQLRVLLRIVRGATDLADTKWGRFTFRDVVAIRAAVRLARAKSNPYKGERLMLAHVERAVRQLRETYGIADPLTTVRLTWRGGRIVAQFEGIHFEPASRQLLLSPAQVDAVVQRLPLAERASSHGILSRLARASAARATCGTPRRRGEISMAGE